MNYVKKVFRRFKKFDLYVNLKKYEFLMIKIEYLDFIINVDNTKMNFRRRNMI